ncbi:protein ECERIFERUM 26-like [Andrographis paniculata]|uniref:protein ECERIFERUM 26-like n=1 Tax=Andrographis paniculata TaxID=175694 RepID=UPI0021E7E56D|nr:protein ECERIFERUM 26-like [Andrographis paniculata]
MVSPPMDSKTLIYDVKVSSIGPADVTGSDLIYEPDNLDLAMKLHYLRGVYYFRSQAFDGLSTLVIKEPMFLWLNKYPMTCGRFRRSDDHSGRPYIKCNDCGVRFIEAKSDKTLDDWFQIKDKDVSLEKVLVPNQYIGPELGFSPLVFVQLTKFKCGGTALSLSWAHVLGDAFSVAKFMNSLGHAVAGHELGEPVDLSKTLTKSIGTNSSTNFGDDPLSVKRVSPVGDNWVNTAKVQMEEFSFNITPTLLKHLNSKFNPSGPQFSPFELISAVIWQCIARIRGEEGQPNIVTICKKSEGNKASGALGNKQLVSVVKADISVASANLGELASMMQNNALEENKKIDEAIEREEALADFILYGANLTFVDLEGSPFYEVEFRGQKPENVSYRIEGVGDQGVILVHPAPKDERRNIMVILPENEVTELKSELEREGLIA